MIATTTSMRCRFGTPCAIAAYVLTMLAMAWMVLRGAESMGYNWQWYRVPRFIILPDGSPGPLAAPEPIELGEDSVPAGTASPACIATLVAQSVTDPFGSSGSRLISRRPRRPAARRGSRTARSCSR